LSKTQTGAFRNKIRNATAVVWGRGASVTMTAGAGLAYGPDGFMVSCTGANVTVAQAAANGGAYAPFGIRLTGQPGVTGTKINFAIESSIAAPLAGRKVFFQVKMVNNAASVTPTFTLKHANSADTWSSSTTDVSAANLQTAAASGAVTQLFWSGTIDANGVNGLSGTIDLGSTLGGASRNVIFYDWDISLADINGPLPIPELRDVTQEIMQCCRYLPSFFNGGGGSNPYFAAGGTAASANSGGVTVPFFTQTRVAVTGVTVSAVADFSVNYRGTVQACTGIAINTNGVGALTGTLTFTTSGLSFAAGESTNLIGSNQTGRVWFTGAELTGSAL
jgi:hypothetical protein